MKKILSCLELRFNFYDLIALISLIFSISFVLIFQLKEIQENTILENLQTIILFLGFLFCFKAKNHKPLFIFGALIFFLMVAREMSYGRVIFAQMPDNPHEFYSWKHFKYGFLAHYIIGAYIGISVLYGIIKKIWINVVEIFKTIKFPIWTFSGCFICLILQLLSEKTLHNTIIEETSELVLYSLLLSLLLYYLKKTK